MYSCLRNMHDARLLPWRFTRTILVLALSATQPWQGGHLDGKDSLFLSLTWRHLFHILFVSGTEVAVRCLVTRDKREKRQKKRVTNVGILTAVFGSDNDLIATSREGRWQSAVQVWGLGPPSMCVVLVAQPGISLQMCPLEPNVWLPQRILMYTVRAQIQKFNLQCLPRKSIA